MLHCLINKNRFTLPFLSSRAAAHKIWTTMSSSSLMILHIETANNSAAILLSHDVLSLIFFSRVPPDASPLCGPKTIAGRYSQKYRGILSDRSFLNSTEAVSRGKSLYPVDETRILPKPQQIQVTGSGSTAPHPRTMRNCNRHPHHTIKIETDGEGILRCYSLPLCTVDRFIARP
jgi:hypothetical protein